MGKRKLGCFFKVGFALALEIWMDGKTGWILFEIGYVIRVKKGKALERKNRFCGIGFG